jgi:hypothetical protein
MLKSSLICWTVLISFILPDILCAGAGQAIKIGHNSTKLGKKLYDINRGWKFRKDPGDIGLREKWFELSTNSGWEPTLITIDWTSQGYDYHGIAWYSVSFQLGVEESKQNEFFDKSGKVALLFGAVDGYADIFLDGKKIGEQKVPPEKMWDKEFAILLPEDFNPAIEHRLVVKVKKDSNAAGIWKPVYIIFQNKCSQAIKIGCKEQLFLDDYIIEQTTNITRKVNPARKNLEPLLKPEHPWEKHGTISLHGTIMYDQQEELFKMWYYCGGSMAYATSKDGLNWEKPELDVALHRGQKTNIVIQRGPHVKQGIKGGFGDFHEHIGVIKDNKDPDLSRRYKVLFISVDFTYDGSVEVPANSYTKYDQSQRRGLGLATSPDGIHWKLENNYVSYEVFDTSRFFWDDSANRFVLYGRNYIDRTDDHWVQWGLGRAVVRMDSTDLREWSKGELVLAADRQDPQDSEIYSMAVFPYEGIYIGLVQMYYSDNLHGNLEIQLACSRDGKNFTRIEPREPFIPEAPVGKWDRFIISVGSMPPVTVGNELWFYYGGRHHRHQPYIGDDTRTPVFTAIGLAKIKQGRFLSLQASFDGGTVLTKPLNFNGSRLSINANAAYGSIKVELLDEQGEQIPGFEATVSGKDDITVPVEWKQGDLKNLANINIKIRFTIKNAQLFGFRILL